MVQAIGIISIVKGNNAKTNKTNDMKDKTIVQISSHLEMVGFIKSNGTGCRFVSMVSETPVTKMKVSSPFKGVLKVSRKTGVINMDYNLAVRNRIAANLGVSLGAVEYESGKTWYKHVETKDGKALPLCVHATKETGEFYLQYYPRGSTNAYVMPNGDPVSETDLKPWLYKESERSEYKPTVIVVNVANIKRLAASGVIMEAEDLDEAEALLSAV